VQRYKLKSFEDTVAHASFSVELALALKLDPLLTEDDKKSLGTSGTSFGNLIHLAEEKAILQREAVKKAWTLNHYRNMCLHPGNWVATVFLFKGLTELEQHAPNKLDVNPLILELIGRHQDRFNDMIKVMKNRIKLLNIIPDLAWTSKEDTLAFQQELLEEYFKNQIKQVMTFWGFIGLLLHRQNIVRYVQNKYSYAEPVMIQALDLSKYLLQALFIL
jgi:hypothetical protein